MLTATIVKLNIIKKKGKKFFFLIKVFKFKKKTKIAKIKSNIMPIPKYANPSRGTIGEFGKKNDQLIFPLGRFVFWLNIPAISKA